jgi:hypothetical protein
MTETALYAAGLRMLGRSPSVSDVEDALLEAASFDRRSPMVRAPGYQHFWPTIVYDPSDWGYQALQLMYLTGVMQRREVRRDLWHVSPRKDIYDLVMMHWLGSRSPLTMKERTVVWCRVGSGVRTPWRKVGKILDESHEKCRRDYGVALLKLHNWCLKKIALT